MEVGNVLMIVILERILVMIINNFYKSHEMFWTGVISNIFRKTNLTHHNLIFQMILFSSEWDLTIGFLSMHN